MATSRTTSTFFVCVTMAAYLAAPIQSCPVNCTCNKKFPNSEQIEVSCEGQGLTSIPTGLPNNTGFLTLPHNNITVLDLSSLYDLELLHNIDLSWNKISKFHGSLEMFKKKDSSFNLVLSHNNIEVIPWKMIGDMQKLYNINLKGNPFNCACDPQDSRFCDCSDDILSCTCNMQWLKNQVQRYFYYQWNVRCQNPPEVRGYGLIFVKLMPDECKTKNHETIIKGSVIAGSVVVVLLVAIKIYRTTKCHCYNQRNGYEQIPDGAREQHLAEARQPNAHEVHGAAPAERQHRPVSKRLPRRLATSKVTKKQIRQKLAKNMGLEWEELAIYLNFRLADVEKFKNDHHKTDDQISAMLMAWRKREGSKATVGNLVKELEAFGVEEEKFDFFLESP